MAELVPSDLSQSLASEIGQLVAAFSIGFAQASRSSNQLDAHLRGSGTLVQVRSTRAILTAHHVLDALPTSGELGLIMSPYVGAHTVEVEALQYLKIARGTEDEQGPDLGAVILPAVLPSSLTAKKSFANLDKHWERIASGQPELRDGLWCLCGLQDALTRDFEPALGFKKLKRFAGFCPIGQVNEAPPIENYDYLSFPIPHGPNSPMPGNIGGTSGGGLWQILLKQEADCRIRPVDCLLSGLAFYQGPIENGWSRVRCHGRKSVYDIARNAIQNAIAM
ncbi:hypothetical protein C8D77_107168 [Mesorhizobium loti]|uniref:Uncharacterized protein n=1 Tax=Rhizobium loti TaxID=381 RepID=A0A8E2WCD0_RHILI|nr:hypothetical protein C8D77_107168 [Mesorhizobium loti]